MIIDLHNHAELSSKTSINTFDYITLVEELGVAFAITEHNKLNKEKFDIDKSNVFTGIEILCDSGDFLVFGAPEECVLYRQDIFKLIEYVHSNGGVIIAAHPYSRCGLYNVLEPENADRVIEKVDAIETLNGLNTLEETRKAIKLTCRFEKPSIGGSDAHHRNQMLKYGTKFKVEITSIKQLVKEIKEGRCEAVEI